MTNLFLFTGEERFLLNSELKRRKDGFSQKFGKNSVFVYNTENFDGAKITESLFSGGLFVSKKLIIINGLPVDSSPDNKIKTSLVEKFIDKFMNIENLSEDVLVIFVSYKPDKRTKFYNFMKKNAEIKEFKSLSAVQLKNFVKERLNSFEITDSNIEKLITKVGKNLYRIDSEIEKIKCFLGFKNQNEIKEDIIEKVVYGSVEINSFSFFDHLFKDKKKAIDVLDNMNKNGIDFNQTAGMLYWGLKLFLMLVDLSNDGISDSKQIMKITKYPPFVVSKNMKNIDNIKLNYFVIKSFFKRLIEIEYLIKTGRLPYSSYYLEAKKFIEYNF